MTINLRKALLPVAAAVCVAAGAQELTRTELAIRDIERAMALMDASWDKTMIGSKTNLYMADRYNTATGDVSGPSDIWPLTAAVEAHCSLLQAMQLAEDFDKDLYDANFDKYRERLDILIDNLEYYRGTYRLNSYATSNKESRPYAVPRASRRGEANVTGILNVYDDQMWLSRELIRAYEITGSENYLELATYLADYVLDGWDCWRDENGEEYGGITWGPGYNSKHACSNAPIIQPLVWLSEIYKDTGATLRFAFRDETNIVKSEERDRSTHYLDFAMKVYDWQMDHLYDDRSGVFWDMMGADGKIVTYRGYRKHVDCGGPVGNFYSYNTGTMIAGAADLYRVTGEARFRTNLATMCRGALNKFATLKRNLKAYDFKTDETAENGFNTWFNNVLIRGYAYALPYCDNNSASNGLNGIQITLDYAFDNHNRDNMLPIHLVNGWGNETVTKPFHQFAFASEYSMLAVRYLTDAQTGGVDSVAADAEEAPSDVVYSLSGVALGRLGEVEHALARGLYIVGGEKRILGN